MDNGNQRLFADDCANTNGEDLSKATFPQNTINSVTSSIAGLQHTVTDSTPPKITSALNKVGWSWYFVVKWLKNSRVFVVFYTLRNIHNYSTS